MLENRPDIQQFVKDKIRDCLSQCTEPQRQLFSTIFQTIEHIAPSKLQTALELCERTVKKNAAKNPMLIVEPEDCAAIEREINRRNGLPKAMFDLLTEINDQGITPEIKHRMENIILEAEQIGLP